MKYMIMMFGGAAEMTETRSPEWITEMIGFMRDLDQELRRGRRDGLQRGPAGRRARAKIVRLTDGVPVATDGPFAETKESLIGFWVLDVADKARILEIAGRIVKYSGVVEVRPVGVTPRRRCERRMHRGPAARAGAAGPRHPGPQVRPVRRLRGRGPGGAARGRRSSGPPGRAGQPAVLAGDGGLPPAGRRVAQRERPAAAGGGGRRAGGRAARPTERPGRHADAALPVLPPRRCRCPRSSR